MKGISCAILFLLYVGTPIPSAAQDAAAPEQAGPNLHWISGPGDAPIGGNAKIVLGGDLVALGEEDTSRFLELNGNPPAQGAYTIASPDNGWFAIFSFDPAGYVKDDEEIDADALLDTLKEQNREGAKERKRLGLSPLVLEGWYVPPHYDRETHRLEWGTRLRTTEDAVIVNYSSRVLGRRGVMHVTLVSEPQYLDRDVADFHAALRRFSFNSGETYAEFKEGDKVAEYGLAALVAGGAAAAAFKFSGVLKGILFAVLAFFGAAWRFIRRLFRKEG